MTRRRLALRAVLALGVGLLLLTAVASAAVETQDARRTNILFIIADDWSWGHAGA